ncbi:MAG: hypothetical protein J6Y48_06120 [Clostridia bacterium]|nr:hypothetical protein [Clostridia bacterium]
MRTDIRLKTCLIIRKNGKYLVGKILWSKDLRWSIYPGDAYRTRDREKAEELARRTGGIVMLFNPIVRQLKVL